MSKMIKRVAAVGAAVAIGTSALAMTAPGAASRTGSATVKEGDKVVREADKQKCLTLKEVRKIVKGKGTAYDGHGADSYTGGTYWIGKGKADYLVVEFNGSKCAQAAYLYYDNSDAYAWIDGKVLWA